MVNHFSFNDIWETSHTLHLYTDAAGSIGFGAVFGCHWLHGIWPEMWKTFNIAVLELFPIVLAVHIWGSLMANKLIIFFSDCCGWVPCFLVSRPFRSRDEFCCCTELLNVSVGAIHTK